MRDDRVYTWATSRCARKDAREGSATTASSLSRAHAASISDSNRAAKASRSSPSIRQVVDKSVSVIVPNYNYASYLKQRLRSIFNQTYPIFEIIVLDDASTDGSLATLDQIAVETGFAILSASSTQRTPAAFFNQWRKGVDCARGDLIWIAEADDDAVL